MKKMYPLVLIFFITIFCSYFSKAQVVLNSDGPGSTYELINGVLAPGYDAVEAPDLIHAGFGRHITEVFDADLNKNVFEFYSHLTPDNDPNNPALTDRQRVEIKTYDQSPANLKGTIGETVTYKWRFKIPIGYQPSSTFSHLHQVKPVDGDDADPLFTLTARKGTTNKLELTYTASSAGSTTKPAIADLSLFEGNWVEATEKIEIGMNGKYSITLKRISDGAVLLTNTNTNILTIRSGNTFIRPKWGIYRSIASPTDLRDEAMRFSDFSVSEAAAPFVGATYYWVGGLAGNIDNATSWNTSLDGSGSDRSTPDPADVLIFDGSNIGGATPQTGGIVKPIMENSITVNQLFFQNGVTVTLVRPAGAFGPAPITNVITVNGDGTSADDFIISANSIVNINAELTGYSTNIVLGSAVGPILATGTIFGTLNIADGGFATTRITAANPSSLFVASGGVITSHLTATTQYPFGTSGSSPAAASLGVVFNAGSKLVYVAGNSVLGNTAAFQAVKFNAGSLLEINANNPVGMFNLKTFANILVKSPAVVTLTEIFYNIDTLTVNSGATFNMRVTGTSPFSGDIIVNSGGAFGAGSPTSANMIMVGIVPQSIGGAGTINNLGALTIGTDAQVTVNKNLNIVGTSTTNITGKLNMQSNTISGTSPYTMRTAATGAASAATITAGTNTVVLTDAAAYTAASVTNGARVVGPAFQPNTFVIGTSSGTFTFTISKSALSSFPALSGLVTLSTSAPTFETSHPNGFDGAITTAGVKSYGTGVNYIFNGATTAPFPAALANSVGSVTVNANITSNKTVQNISGTLTLNAGKITIRPLDTLRITSGNDIAGAPFSASKYIVSGRTGNNLGVLRIDNFATPKTYPIGSATNYLPVTLTPSSPMSYATSVFEGATVDGTPTGALVSAAIKDESVDAVWTINRTLGSGDCVVQLNWLPALEGSMFSTFSNANIGISRYDGAVYETSTGSGDNTLNTANASFINFSPFIVTKKGSVLPVQFKNIEASVKQNAIEVKWNVESEYDIQSYIVEKSIDGRTFAPIGTVIATNSRSYTFNDASVLSDKIFYYRIKIVDISGNIKYSNIVFVKKNTGNDIVIFPNPVLDLLNIGGLKANTTIKLFNAAGQIVVEKNTTASSLSMDVSSIKPGIYTLQFFNNTNEQVSKKVIKQ